MKPGEIITCEGESFISANENLEIISLEVSNTGDRPIQVGSHIHFFEVNRALQFDREKSRGFRLNVPREPRLDSNRAIRGKSNWWRWPDLAKCTV